MSKKSYILALMVGILLVLMPSIYADDYCTWGNPIYHYNLTANGYDCVGEAPNTGLVNRTFSPHGSGIVFSANGTTFNGANELINTNTSWLRFGTHDFSVCFNASFSATNGYYQVIAALDGSNNGWAIFTQSSKYNMKRGSTNQLNSGVPMIADFHEYCFTANATGLYMYTDGILNQSTSNTNSADDGGATFPSMGTTFYDGIGKEGNMKGTLNSLSIYYYSLSNGNVSDRFNKVGFGGGGSTPSGTISITLLVPANNTINNTNSVNFIFNNSISFANVTNFSIWLSNSTSGNFSLIQTNTTALNINNTNNFTLNINDDGTYLWNIQLTLDNGSSYFASKNYTFIYDIVLPTYTTNFINNSIYIFKNISAQFNLSDNNLIHSYNISIDGVSIQGNESINTKTFTADLNYNLSALSIGSHILNLRFADGHTAQNIGNYQYDTGLFGNELNYYTGKNYVYIAPIDGSFFDRFNTQKQFDRYTFNYLPSDINKQVYSFDITSDNKIDIVSSDNEPYSWLIIGNENWIDCYMPNYPNIIPQFTQISDNEVQVDIDFGSGLNCEPGDLKCNQLPPQGQNHPAISFSSIGDLNVVSKNFSLYTGSVTVSYAKSVIEGQQQTLTENITKISGITTNAAIYYDLSYKTLVNTSTAVNDYYTATFITPIITNSTETRQINFTYTVSNGVSSESGFIPASQIIYKIGIDNCSNYSIRTLNIISYEDAYQKYINSSINMYLTIGTGIYNNQKAFNISLNGWYNYSLCLFNDSATYNVYAQMEYLADPTMVDYNKETYYLYNTTLTNVTQQLGLYLTPNGTYTQLHVTDQDDTVVSGAYIIVLRYDLPTNTYYTTEIVKTDDTGTGIANLILVNQWYKFVIVYNGQVVFTSDATKVLTTTRNFRINLINNFFNEQSLINGLQTSLIYNNATNNFIYTFTNPTGTSITACLEVSRSAAMKTEVLNTTCLTSSSGIIFYNIGTNPNGYTYKGYSYIKGSWWSDITLFIDQYLTTKNDYTKLGADGLLGITFLRITIAMIAIWNPVVAIIILLLTDLLLLMMHISYWSPAVWIMYLIIAGMTAWRMARR